MNETVAKIYCELPFIIKANLDDLKEHHGDLIDRDYLPEMIAEHRKFIDGYIHALCDLQLIKLTDIEPLRSYLTR